MSATSTGSNGLQESSLPRTLPLIETLSFGLTGLLLWIGVVPGAHAELGMQAIWVWIPGAIFGIIVNWQVRCLGEQLPDIAGGTPNYLSYLLPEAPWLTRYAALGYFLSWVAVLPVNAIILTDLIEARLSPLGIDIPTVGLRVGFLLLAFVLAFSGSRALSTLHLIFLLPAVGLLLTFYIQGSIWFATSVPIEQWPSISPAHTGFSLQGWAKWYLSGTYAFYACETAAAFVADSKHPRRTLTSLLAVAGLIPVVYVLGSWLLLYSLDRAPISEDIFLVFSQAAGPFWGAATPVLVTFLVVSSCLLSLATAVAIAPRILYQLARDRQLAPLFGRVTERGVFSPGLVLIVCLSMVGLAWGDLNRIVVLTGVGWLAAFISLHLGLWLRRGQPGVMLPGLALVMAAIEILVLAIGGWSWGLENFILGLLLPCGLLAVSRLVQNVAPLASSWQTPARSKKSPENFEEFVAIQAAVLVGFVGIVATVSWFASAAVARADTGRAVSYLTILILVLSFLAVAIACWTLLPKVMAVNEARQVAESRSHDLKAALEELQQAQMKLIQQEKLSSLGQLVAGVAHEINNPVNFIHGNLHHARDYSQQLLELIALYQQNHPQPAPTIEDKIDDIDLEFLSEDFTQLLDSMSIGTQRIREIVLSLRNFSRADESLLKTVDIHDGLESTLLILQHRLKAKPDRPVIAIQRDYCDIPPIECYPGPLNQVFINILANAIDALEEKRLLTLTASPQADAESQTHTTERPGTIKLSTRAIEERWIEIEIADNGAGIPEGVQARIFEPFFTTKDVGSGTGLGMSISHQIVTELHQGEIAFASSADRGTKFTIRIPISRAKSQ
ncbi:MAG: ATP-binding protein [Geitlerinemataceae cyanobacterium]